MRFKNVTSRSFS